MLRRVYHLIRRYQPFFWSVFRTDKLLTALRHARTSGIVFFQEMTFMATIVVLGKFTRLPCIYTLRGTEESLTSRAQSHPFFALLDDSDGFFSNYHRYRESLAVLIEAKSEPLVLSPKQVRHFINLLHTIYFRPDLDARYS
jgi:hypothetical protein